MMKSNRPPSVFSYSKFGQRLVAPDTHFKRIHGPFCNGFLCPKTFLKIIKKIKEKKFMDPLWWGMAFWGDFYDLPVKN